MLGRSITLMLIECVIMFALVLALQRASADSDPWRSLARLVQRRVSRVVAELRWLSNRDRTACASASLISVVLTVQQTPRNLLQQLCTDEVSTLCFGVREL